MTVRLSPHKVTRLMGHYFGGIPQTKIAKRAGVDQSTVSIYVSRFRDRAAKMGLLAAGKEFQVFNEVDELRSLSVELSKAKLTVGEAKEGLRIAKLFMKLGINSNQHTILVKVCKEVNDPGFIHAAVKLSKIKGESNMSYEGIISRFEKVTSQLPSVEKQLQETQAELESAHKSLVQRKQELAGVEAQLAQLQNESKAKGTKLEQEFAIKMKKLNVQYKEVEEVAKLKAELDKQGLNLPTLIKLAKEFSHVSTKG